MNCAIVLANKKFAPLATYPLLMAPLYSYVVESLKKIGIKDINVIHDDNFDLNGLSLGNANVLLINGDIPFINEEISKVLEAKKEILVTCNYIYIKNDLYKDLIKNNGNVKCLIDYIKNKYKNDTVSNLEPIKDFKSLSEVEMKLKRKINEEHMLSGVYIENPDTVAIGVDVKIDSGVMIRANTYLAGNTIIKCGCTIGPNSEIHNSTIDENTSVIHSLVMDSKIGKNTTVGPFTHIRMHSELGDYIRAGNFIEVKNSIIANGTKMSHLSYIGDTDCGSNVNWGCGCVTVNYDGVNKNRTTIGDNVFIGCNTNLIAPVVLGDNTYIAAGSTITDNIPTGAFAIARAHQVNKEGYAKKYFSRKKEKK